MLPLRDDAPTRNIPWATYALLFINIVVFLFLQPPGYQNGDLSEQSSRADNEFAYKWAAVPCELAERETLADGADCSGERESDPALPEDKNILATVITHMFLHGNLLHLLGNMLFLWVFGNYVEDRLGPWPFLGLYLASGVVAMFGHAAFNWHDAVPMLGASGAIAGLLGAYLILRPRGRILVATAVAGLQILYMPAWSVLGLFFLEQFFIDEASGVAWIAHAAGMIAGALLALLLARLVADPQMPRFDTARPRSADWTLPEAPPTVAETPPTA
jgi:membrane associated rhomboid family serine protease